METGHANLTLSPKLGHYLECSDESIESVLARQAPRGEHGPKRLGEMLVEGCLISNEALHSGLLAQRIDRLRGCPLFSDFGRRELARIADVFEEVSIDADSLFIRQGQREAFLYVLATGTLAVHRETPEGELLDLGTAGPGEPVGEIAYVSGGIRTATVSAVTRCELLRASFTGLRVLLDEVPRLAHAFMDIITRRLMNTTERFEHQTRRLRQVERSLARLSDFLDLSDANEVGLGIEQLMTRLVSTASSLTDADRASLFLVDPVTGNLWSKIAEGAHAREVWVPFGQGVAGWVAEQRELVNIADAYDDERFHRDVDRRTGYRTRTILCAPIWSLGGEVLGVVQVVNKRHGTFGEDDETLIRAFAHQAAIAVENFYLYRKITASHSKMAMLLELTSAIGDTLDLPTLIRRVVSRTADAMRCDRCSFWVVDDNARELWSMESSGGEMTEIRIPSTSGLVGHAVKSGEVINVPDAYADDRFNREVDRHTGYLTKNVLCMPVLNREGKVLGVAQCINKLEGVFDDEDIAFATAIAAQIAIGLENSQLHTRALDMSRYLENVQASIAAGIVTLDESARIVTSNPAAKRLLPQIDTFGDERDCMLVLGHANRDLRLMIDEAFECRSQLSRQDMLVDGGPLGTKSTVNADVLPLTDRDGAFKGLVVVLEDVTNERRIKRAFGHYLAPTVIDQLLSDPNKLSLGGEKRRITALFTDIEDFTSLSEAVDPSELVQLLNEYFDAACNVVLRHGGTIDKIVGDSLHVLFNAPVDQDDHELRAVRCALDLQATSRAIRARRSGDAPKLGHTRVGVNTGTCVVGNFGGSARFDYTAHGDPINVAARLEGANKHLGTRICVSDATRAHCSELHFRPVGALVLKGKTEAIEVFEPITDEQSREPFFEQYLSAYAALDQGDLGVVDKFRDLASRYPNEPLVRFHSDRLLSGESGTVVVLESK